MSWNISLVGTPDDIVKSLESHGDGLDAQSRTEFEAAKPYLVGLVRQNFFRTGESEPTVRIQASGNGTESGGEPTSRVCRVSIEPTYLP